MAKVYTYISPNTGGKVNANNLATKDELKKGVQEAKDYTDEVVNNINQDGGSNHVHSNKSALDQLTVSNGDLFFNGEKLTGVDVVFETVEG